MFNIIRQHANIIRQKQHKTKAIKLIVILFVILQQLKLTVGWCLLCVGLVGRAAPQEPAGGDQPTGAEAGEAGQDGQQTHLLPQEAHQQNVLQK